MADCTCETCIAACHYYPGWMSIEDAQKAIAAGFANKLMLDYWCGNEYVYVLCPAVIGSEGEDAPFWPQNISCTFLKDNRCSIHDSGFKPKVCRESMLCAHTGPEKDEIKIEWDTNLGRALIAQWKDLVAA